MNNCRLPASRASRLVLCLLLLSPCASAQTAAPPYKDTSLPIDRRVDDLVARMTLEEKIAQMMNGAAGVERLGVPEYEWWNEALHGVARAGIATVFPQAIGLAATWDPELIRRVADVISTEARAKHHEFARRGERKRYQGLTFWSPNINIFRDPRWGRGQETYGEDPYLTSRIGVAFVKGLQGDDPKYLKVAATAKHYAVHSGPEPERHSFDAVASERDMRETYLPAFRDLIVEGRAEGVMCAYNRTNGEPACANRKLFDILRREWKFGGHVVSDCAAVEDIWKHHKFTKTEAEASALAVKSGTDLTCGREYRSLAQAVKDGLISEAEIDVAVKRLMRTRFRLGMFDPPEMVAYARIPFSENDSPAHRALALDAARESVVLLKNEANTLPLRKDLKTLAVIGPNADAPDVLLGNYNGQPSKSVTPLQGIAEKVAPATKVLYSQGVYQPGTLVAPVSTSAFGPEGVRGEYFNNKDWKGEPALVRADAQLNFNWGSLSPAQELHADNFSIRWTGKLVAPESGKYLLGLSGNGGLRLLLDGRAVVEDFANQRTRTLTQEVELEGGRAYDLRVEYQENANHYAAARLVWAPPSGQKMLREDALAKARQADAVVMVMGITPSVEGEEMKVNAEGFRGGDRTSLDLPKEQEDLIKEVHALGKPVVLVLLGGSAIAVNWADEHVGAVVEAWYPGEEGGTALADVLFGDYNPSGRLPVTFYKSASQLPPFEEYGMQGRTYRYFKGDPLYPFGHGLSYTKFAYGKLKLSASDVRAGEGLTVSAEVQNVGAREGDEVVQLYVTDEASAYPVPVRSLAGISRVRLRPGEKRTVTFKLDARQLSVIDDRGRRVVEPGRFAVSVGGKQPGFKGRADAATTGVVSGGFNVTGKATEIPEP
ncbi:MAG TPA: glycoside hydrolase family 3 C-terminal domain-containing protein [Pyrinomonadaceae bacterium]|jgi:beta-glucosidase|nr:glycoside hydrolase family 3 C-terminal domain-containing protein [Pyrinomonadaceae bacterium]